MSSSVYSYFFSKTWGRRYRCTFCDLDTQAFPLETIWKVAFPLFGAASYPVSWNWKLGVIFCFLDLMQSSISKPKTLLGNHRFIRSPPVLKFWYSATFSTLWAKNYGYPEDHCLLILPSNGGMCRDFVLFLSFARQCVLFPSSNRKVILSYPLNHLFTNICLASLYPRHRVRHSANNAGRRQLFSPTLKKFTA